MKSLIYIFTILNLSVAGGMYFMQKTGEIEQLKFLVATYKAETDILTAQNSDILNQLNQRVATSYNNGFEDGRTQAGVSVLHDGTMQSYAD